MRRWGVPFQSLQLHPNLLTGLKELGFVKPTPIQSEAIPPALAGRDLLACAMTGSGKTAAFLLPILHHLIAQPRGTTRALVISPTRELAAQIVEDLNDLAVHSPVTGAAVFGGVGMRPQEHAFRSGTDVIVATPGRLLDHLRFPYVKLGGLTHLVLDEADRMLDMGFLPDIRRILKHVPAKRQTLFFSATMPAPIAALARDMLRDPVLIDIGRPSAPATGITQAAYPIAQLDKAALLVALLRRDEISDALVFTRTKHRADRLQKVLAREGIQAERIHGNRSQGQRTQALAGFKSGRYRVLVATDIAARGIDVEALGHVVNFDVPKVPADYIHRVGRTARAEATGVAFTFVAPDEEADLRDIEKALGKRLPRVTLPGLASEPPLQSAPLPAPRPQGADRGRGGGRGGGHHQPTRQRGAGSGGGGRRSAAPARRREGSPPPAGSDGPVRPAGGEKLSGRRVQGGGAPDRAGSPGERPASHPPRRPSGSGSRRPRRGR